MIIKAKNISKSFKKFKAVDNLEMSVKKGSVHGFLGPNGAGKTTVIRILLGLLSPDSAEIEIMGYDLFLKKDKILSQVGAVVESPAFFEYMSAYENLHSLSWLSGKTDRHRIEETLDIVGLLKVRNKKVREFSYGMKQRLGIAQSMLPDNQLIFLDEPVNGLDPHGIVDVRKLIRRLAEEHSITVFLSSHLLSEVEQTCDRVTIIDKGRKVCEEDVTSLMERHQGIEIITPDIKEFNSFATGRNMKIISESEDALGRKFLIEGKETLIPGIVKGLADKNIKVFRAAKHQKILEEIFVELTA